MLSEDRARLLSAFPRALAADAAAVLAMLPNTDPTSHGFTVRVGNDTLEIPQRIYLPAVEWSGLGLSDIQQALLACLYTRHRDGHVRERAAAAVAALAYDWVPPFVVQLVGEYVVQIILRIQRQIPGLDVPESAERRRFGRFAVDNPEFVALTSARVDSYWNCYYRHSGIYGAPPTTWATFDAYPGAMFMRQLREAADEVRDS